jgi:hypothetical protein
MKLFYKLFYSYEEYQDIKRILYLAKQHYSPSVVTHPCTDSNSIQHVKNL